MADRIVKWDLKGLNGMARQMRRELRGGAGSGPVRTWLRQMGTRYLAFSKRRFAEHSRGGGDWKPLAPSTIRQRRRGGPGAAAGETAILRDTSTLFAALSKGGANNLFRDMRNGVRVGFSANTHPTGQTTIQDVAHYHNVGGAGGRPPRRPIFVEPDRATLRSMLSDGRRQLSKLMKENELK